MQPRSDPTNLLFDVRPEQPPFPLAFVFFHRPSSISLVASRFLFTPFFPLSTFDCLHLPASNPIIRSVRQEPVAPLQTPSLCHLQRRCFNSSASRTLCTDEVFNSAPNWIANRAKTSAVCGPHLQSSTEEVVVQTSAVCSKKTVCFLNICRLED
ncbi:hypothetical protein LXL04_024176 [Taraxacum kok-saghyz]